MDAATLIIIYALHSGERRVMRRPIVEATACEELKRAMRASHIPLGQRVKGWVLYCSPRSVPAARPDEPKAFLRVTWQGQSSLLSSCRSPLRQHRGPRTQLSPVSRIWASLIAPRRLKP